MARRLRSIEPDSARPLRLLGIIRVSKERDEMISPENQQHKIENCAATNGYVLAPTPDGQPFLYGLDESGSQKRSSWWRKLDEAIGWVEAGQYDGIIVWKFSRVARNRLKWNLALDRVESAGGVLVSATEDFDVTTSAGRLGRGISAEFNAFQADLIGEGWTEAHERRVRNGLPHSGRARFGYTYDLDRKIHVPDPEQAPVLASLYSRYIAGESIYALARWLNDHGWRTVDGNPWRDRVLRRVLDNGFAAGFFAFREQLHQGVHEPLITLGVWQAYLDARGARRRLPPRTERSQYLLSGLVRCARCGGPMAINYSNPGTRLAHRPEARAEGKRYSNGKPKWVLRCQQGKETGRCKGGSVRMEIVEAFVRAHLEMLAGKVDETVATKEASGKVLDARGRLLLREEERLDGERDKAKAALKQLLLRDAERPMPRDIFDEARGELEDKIQRLTEAVEAAGRTQRRSARTPAIQAASLLAEWDEIQVVNRREILRGLIDCVLVGTGKSPYLRVVEWEDVRPEAF